MIEQLPLIVIEEFADNKNSEDEQELASIDRSNFGTFQDSLRAPIHRWFTYPAGFSYKAVEEAFKAYHIKAGMKIYDPFAGTGTTNIVASHNGVDSYGIEAHPFVAFVAQTKLYWDYDYQQLLCDINELLGNIHKRLQESTNNTINVAEIFPELVLKCYTLDKLIALYICREAIMSLPASPFRDLAKLTLTAVLRSAADVETGWPYIAPKKSKSPRSSEDSSYISKFVENKLREQLYLMYADLKAVTTSTLKTGTSTLIQGDSREKHAEIADTSIDLAFTSPPYLNNYDYSDRTRLEMYFWGDATSWSDITRKVRTKLITSATTQISRSAYKVGHFLNDDFCQTAPAVAQFLLPRIAEMSEQRLVKGGKKSYDIMVAGYFNDMLLVMRETFRVLKNGGHFLLILGDSAPYGVHIPTDILLGDLGKAVGFAPYHIDELRKRGDKWRENPQRHKVKLRESILYLRKE